MALPTLTTINKSADHIHNFWKWIRGFFSLHKEDKIRYEYIIQSIDASSIDYFQRVEHSCMRQEPFQALRDAEYAISPVQNLPNFISKKLRQKEEKLKNTLADFNKYVAYKTFRHKTCANLFTIYWDNFDEFDSEQCQRAIKIENNIYNKAKNILDAFIDFRDYGNKIFAQKHN